MDKYLVKRALSHNVVLARDISKNEEYILLGKGIGFGMKEGELVDPEKIEKKYIIRDSSNLNKYQKLIENCDEKLIFIVEEYIEKISSYFGCNFNESLHIGLLDHLNFSLYRYRNNVTIANIFIDEISMMYDKEYAFAKVMLEDLNKRLGVQLPDVEVGFIALHIHSSIKGEQPSQTALYLKIIGECLEHIEKEFDIKLESNSFNRGRLITHLKFALKRTNEKRNLDDKIFYSLKSTYPKAYQEAKSLAHMIYENYDISLSEGEIGYLTLHIENSVNSK